MFLGDSLVSVTYPACDSLYLVKTCFSIKLVLESVQIAVQKHCTNEFEQNLIFYPAIIPLKPFPIP